MQKQCIAGDLRNQANGIAFGLPRQYPFATPRCKELLQNFTAPMCRGTEYQNIGLHALVERFNR